MIELSFIQSTSSDFRLPSTKLGSSHRVKRQNYLQMFTSCFRKIELIIEKIIKWENREGCKIFKSKENVLIACNLGDSENSKRHLELFSFYYLLYFKFPFLFHQWRLCICHRMWKCLLGSCVMYWWTSVLFASSKLIPIFLVSEAFLFFGEVCYAHLWSLPSPPGIGVGVWFIGSTKWLDSFKAEKNSH